MISMTREPLLRNVMRCGLWIILWSWYFQICVECCGVFCFFYRYNDVIIYPQCLVCSLYLSTGGSKVRVSNRDSIQLITNLKNVFISANHVHIQIRTCRLYHDRFLQYKSTCSRQCVWWYMLGGGGDGGGETARREGCQATDRCPTWRFNICRHETTG